MGVSTLHRKENGRQATYRVVKVEDATGDTFPHLFELTENGDEKDEAHTYVGAGDHPETVEEREEAPSGAWDVLADETDEGEAVDTDEEKEDTDTENGDVDG